MISQRALYRLYGGSPAALRAAFDRLYYLIPERLLRSGQTHRFLAELEQTQWWDAPRLEAYRLEKMRKLLVHAGKSVPYYRRLFRELGFEPSRITALSDVSVLPVLTLEMIKALGDELLPDNTDRQSGYIASSSGSTGNYLECVRDAEYYAWEQAFLLRYMRWHGTKLRWRQAMFYRAVMEHPVESDGHPPYERYRNRLILSQFHTDEKSLRFYLALLGDFQPEHVLIFPTTLLVLTRTMRELNIDPPFRPGFFICYSENLYEQHRREAEEFWGCPVFNRYGHSEGCVSAAECERQRLHVSTELGYVELLGPDGQQVLPGESGRIIATGFHTQAMPLIRYDTRDYATMSAEACPCGRTLPVFTSVDGRADDLVRAKDGKVVASLRSVFARTKGIRLTQIVQEHEGEIIIRIVPDRDYDASVQDVIRANLLHDVGDVFDLRFELVDDVERTPSGKVRLVLSKTAPRI